MLKNIITKFKPISHTNPLASGVSFFYTSNLARFAHFGKLALILLVIFGPMFLAGGALAAMQSDNYVIYENVMHSFDGPVISGVGSSGVDDSSAIIAWTTNVNADSFVEYDTDSGFVDSKEQGTSADSSTSHSVTLAGLNSSTVYYYRVKSTRLNGGTAVEGTSHTFTTVSAPGDEEEDQGGGGGILVIDKTDKIAPEISNVKLIKITHESAVISWETNEDSSSFVQYGATLSYGATYGDWTPAVAHQVEIKNLSPLTLYHYRALSSDDWGNLGMSEDKAFETTAVGEVKTGEDITEETPPEPEKKDESVIIETSRRALEIVTKLIPQVSINFLEKVLPENYNSLEDLAGLIPGPILSGQPRVETEATKATVYWQTDQEANSAVAVAAEGIYAPAKSESYVQVVGDFDNYVLNHQVQIIGLKPDTLYHFQVRSKSAIGPTSKSKDFTFRTSLETFEISNFLPQIIDDQTAVFKWITNRESDSSVKFTPYRGNVLSVEEAKTAKDNFFSLVHEIKVAEFEGGTTYDVEVASVDKEGHRAIETLSSFMTSKDDLPPKLSYIKAASTLFTDQDNKVQSIISWTTNEPSTSRVYFQEGVHGGDKEFAENTGLNTDYAKEHIVVITKFKQGTVYSFKIESIDSGGNANVSKVHTLMTPKQKESIIQIIIRILEDTFGWMKKMR